MEMIYIYMMIAAFLVMFVILPILVIVNQRKEDKSRSVDGECTAIGTTAAQQLDLSSDSGGGDGGGA